MSDFWSGLALTNPNTRSVLFFGLSEGLYKVDAKHVRKEYDELIEEILNKPNPALQEWRVFKKKYPRLATLAAFYFKRKVLTYEDAKFRMAVEADERGRRRQEPDRRREGGSGRHPRRLAGSPARPFSERL